MPSLIPFEPGPGGLPDPIPASYYARPAAARRPPAVTPAAPGPAGRLVREFLGWPRWKQGLLSVACLVGAVWVVQLPWRPLLAVLGLLVIAAGLLAVNAGGLRDRVPLLGSPSPGQQVAGWAGAAGLLLLTGGLAAASAGSPGASAQARVQGSAPPAHTAAPATRPTPPALAAVPSAEPTPTPTPTRPPTPTPAAVTFLNAPLSAHRGETVTLLARTTPDTRCSTTVGYPSAPPLAPATSDAAGAVRWTWHVSSHAPRGTWPISTTCGGGSGSSQIAVS